MRVRITYEITGKEFEDLIEDSRIVKAEIVSSHNGAAGFTNKAVIEWLKEKDINGYAVKLAYKQFCEADPSANLSLIGFSKAVKATGVYITKNLRIGDAVQRCFIRLDGENL